MDRNRKQSYKSGVQTTSDKAFYALYGEVM